MKDEIPNNSQELLKKYFFDPLSKLVRPTYYQYQYWISLFYESCVNFSSTYQIKKTSILENYDKQSQEKYKMKTFRSTFFKTLLENSIEFLTYSVNDL